MVQTVLLHLAVFLVLCAMVEVILPEGTLRPYIRFFIGLLTVLFLLTLGGGITVSELWPDFSGEGALNLEEAEARADERVLEMLRERIVEDILLNVPGCVEVCSVAVDETGVVTALELVVNRIVSRSEIAERYGVSPDNIVIIGAGEQ